MVKEFTDVTEFLASVFSTLTIDEPMPQEAVAANPGTRGAKGTGPRRDEPRAACRDFLTKWRVDCWFKNHADEVWGPDLLLPDKVLTKLAATASLQTKEDIRSTIEGWWLWEIYSQEILDGLRLIDMRFEAIKARKEADRLEQQQIKRERRMAIAHAEQQRLLEEKERKRLLKEEEKRQKDEEKRRKDEEKRRKNEEKKEAKRQKDEAKEEAKRQREKVTQQKEAAKEAKRQREEAAAKRKREEEEMAGARERRRRWPGQDASLGNTRRNDNVQTAPLSPPPHLPPLHFQLPQHNPSLPLVHDPIQQDVYPLPMVPPQMGHKMSKTSHLTPFHSDGPKRWFHDIYTYCERFPPHGLSAT